jgi:hypothetical protein
VRRQLDGTGGIAAPQCRRQQQLVEGVGAGRMNVELGGPAEIGL